VSVRLSSEPLEASQALRELGRSGAGGVALFFGAVRRDRTARGTVRALWYEADARMGRRALETIAREVARRQGVRAVVLWHRTGRVAVGEVAVIVGAAAAHRAQAFDAARELIERVKSEVPIWKTDRLGPARRAQRRREPGTSTAPRSGRIRRRGSAGTRTGRTRTA
jgi:molybdopterin synthase catalytic subunit